MIDWATLIVPVRHTRSDLDSGMVLTVGPDGQIEKGFERAFHLRGSHESRVTVKSFNPDDAWRGFAVAGDAVHQHREQERHWLWIDGNPSKWRWGHNLFGTDDPALIAHWLSSVLRALGLGWESHRTLDRTRVNRIDVTRSFRLDSDTDVARWLRAAELNASMKYRGRGNLLKGQTLYFGKHSRRWALKCYSKGKELIDHPIPDTVQGRDELTAWASGILRIEARFMAMHLKENGLKYLTDYSTETVTDLWNFAMERLHLQHTQPTTLPPDVSSGARATYYQWLAGVDLASVLPRSTWYRHRSELLSSGLDISIPATRGQDVPSLSGEIIARPARPPQWATDPVFKLAA